MVAINFQQQFTPAIRAGRKTQTIRKTARCETGDLLQLYSGQRTKNCEKIGTAWCAICEPITIAEGYIAAGGYYRLQYGAAEHIAKIDGFDSFAAMRDWFRERYGLPFQGYRIMWHGFERALSPTEGE